MPHLYVIRHGQTVCNEQQIIQGPRVDSELSELGLRQAHALGEAFEETPVTGLFASPLLRARATAQGLLVRDVGRAGLQVVPEYYEMDFGTLCGRSMDEARDTLQEVVDAWSLGFIDRAFPGGESPVLAQHRVRGFADRLRRLAAHEDIAVIGHGRINRILLSMLLGRPLRTMQEFPQANANISHLELVDGTFHLRRLNDTAHLGGLAS